MIGDYYTQHRERAARPEHRVRIFFRPYNCISEERMSPDHSVLIGTLELDTVTGKVACDPEEQTRYIEEVTGPAFFLLGELWAWVGEAIPQAEGLA